MAYLEYYTDLFLYLDGVLDRLNGWSKEYDENQEVVIFFIERKEELNDDVAFQLEEYVLEQCSNLLREMADSIDLYTLPTLDRNETNTDYLENCVEKMIELMEVLQSIMNIVITLSLREFDNYLFLLTRHMNDEYNIALRLYMRL